MSGQAKNGKAFLSAGHFNLIKTAGHITLIGRERRWIILSVGDGAI